MAQSSAVPARVIRAAVDPPLPSPHPPPQSIVPRSFSTMVLCTPRDFGDLVVQPGRSDKQQQQPQPQPKKLQDLDIRSLHPTMDLRRVGARPYLEVENVEWHREGRTAEFITDLVTGQGDLKLCHGAFAWVMKPAGCMLWYVDADSIRRAVAGPSADVSALVRHLLGPTALSHELAFEVQTHGEPLYPHPSLRSQLTSYNIVGYRVSKLYFVDYTMRLSTKRSSAFLPVAPPEKKRCVDNSDGAHERKRVEPVLRSACADLSCNSPLGSHTSSSSSLSSPPPPPSYPPPPLPPAPSSSSSPGLDVLCSAIK